MPARPPLTHGPAAARRLLLLALLGTMAPWLAPPPARAADDPFAKWEKEIAAIEAKARAHPPAPDTVLFTGSSSIRLWDLARAFPGLKTANHGFGGSTIPDNIHFLPRLVLPFRPKTIVFYAGDNDSAAGRTAERIAADFQAYAAKVHAALPDTRILYLPIKPSIARWHLRPLQQDANDRIRRLCEADPKRLRYVDTAATLLDAGGKPLPGLFKQDGLHLNDQGYARWAPLVARAIRETAD